MSSASTIDGLLDPLSRCLDIESARRVVELRVDPSVQERIDALAERANEGLLTGEERTEYEALINAADFISILKVKARHHLVESRPEHRKGSAAAVLQAMRETPHLTAQDVRELENAIAAGSLPVRDGDLFSD